MRTVWRQNRLRWGMVLALVCGLAPSLAACSASGSGLGQLPLSGLGAAAGPSSPPTVTGSGPGGSYAFVYGNQIWLKDNGSKSPHQLTHLVIQSGAYVAWGPLVWSPDGHSIAFVLLQDPSGGHPARTSGPLYVADAASGAVRITPGTASIQGHSYAWYGINALFYANPSGISFADLSDPSDPRSFSVAPGQDGPSFNGGATFYSYTDIAFLGRGLLATQLAVTAPGASGRVGQAQLVRFDMRMGPQDYTGGSMNIGYGGLYGFGVNDLGQAYAGPNGAWQGGSWQVSDDGGLMVQKVTGIDTKAGTVSSTICYNYAVGDDCDQQLFQQVAKQPVATAPQFAFAPGGRVIAMTGSSLAIQQRDGGSFSSNAPATAGLPEWSGDGKTVAATQIVTATPDAGGVIDYQTNIVTFAGGAKGVVAIAGARNLSWAPA